MTFNNHSSFFLNFLRTYMNTIITTVSAATTADSKNVVSNDNSKASYNPLTVVENTIDKLVEQRKEWQDNTLRKSNDQLYGLLQSCYALYKSMEGTEASAKALRNQLNAYIDNKGYIFKKTTHTIAKLIKCVFGIEDRRRISTYTLVLRSALKKNTSVMNLVKFIKDAGGIEEIRLSRSPNALTAKQKAVVGASTIVDQNMGTVSSDELAATLDAGKVDQPVLLIGVWQADGSVVVRAVVDSQTALNAALASQYSAVKAAVKEQAAEKAAQVIEDAQQKAIEAALKTATVVV
jgi:hypothetical protein